MLGSWVVWVGERSKPAWPVPLKGEEGVVFPVLDIRLGGRSVRGMDEAEELLPDLQAVLVCEDVRLEASGSNTLVGVVNVIAAPAIPFRIIKLCVFTRWSSGEGRFVQRTRILSPTTEDVIAQSDTAFQLDSPGHHATNVAFFGGLEFSEWGDYPVEILLDGDLVSRFTVKVVQVQPPGC